MAKLLWTYLPANKPALQRAAVWFEVSQHTKHKHNKRRLLIQTDQWKWHDEPVVSRRKFLRKPNRPLLALRLQHVFNRQSERATKKHTKYRTSASAGHLPFPPPSMPPPIYPATIILPLQAVLLLVTSECEFLTSGSPKKRGLLAKSLTQHPTDCETKQTKLD